jgi:cellulose synthase/poly-beta-1,6-N-acetylglucosamine synthase-like glycosyltransferase
VTIFLVILFFVAAGLVFHSYVLYPLLLQWLNGRKTGNSDVFTHDELPELLICMSVFNEQKVIRQKLDSIISTTYPIGKLKVWIGSDNSTDQTNVIIQEYALKYPFIQLFAYSDRNGKSGVLNKLHEQLNAEYSPSALQHLVLVLTDANVFFEQETLFELAKHFKNPLVAQVGANILNSGLKEDGIAIQEQSYIQRENYIKHLEGLSGTMQGAFGACYALRASYFPEIPANFLMEDFYISMYVLNAKQQAILELKAIGKEDVSNEVAEEFKRKTRISAGNFQNLGVYWSLLFRFDFNAFCFLSHKVLRWFTPFLLLICFLSSLLLLRFTLFKIFVVLQLLLFSTPFIDLLLKTLDVHSKFIRLMAYFVVMNVALVNGLKIYWSGVKTNAWTPTKRNV